jgi:hypothetical protein
MTKNKPDLILDLDETLIKSHYFDRKVLSLLHELNNDKDKKNYINNYPELLYTLENCDDSNLLIEFELNDKIFVVYKRPYLIEFLTEMDKYFNITIYSLGEITYVNIILSKIKRIIGYDIFKDVWANDMNDYKYVKLLYNVDVDYYNCLIIDDKDVVWPYNKNKLYNIKPYVDIGIDSELKDISDKIKRYMNTHNVINCNLILDILND